MQIFHKNDVISSGNLPILMLAGFHTMGREPWELILKGHFSPYNNLDNNMHIQAVIIVIGKL